MKNDEIKNKDKDITSTIDFSDDFFFDSDDFDYPSFFEHEALEIVTPTELPALSLSDAQQAVHAKTDKKDTAKKITLNDILGIVAAFILSIPSLIEKVGDITVENTIAFVKKYGSYLAIPFIFIKNTFKKAFLKCKKAFANTPNHFAHDLKNMIYELRIIRKQSMALKSKKLSSYAKALRKYFVISFSRHKLFWKTVFNAAFPVFMVIIVALLVSHNGKKMFALDVIYNDTHIGYVESEDTFEKAKAEAEKLLPSNLGKNANKTSLDAGPIYRLSRVSPNQLSNQSMITEGLISASTVSLERACGIYIDGEFLCAVKNESDAVSVFNNLLAPSKKKASNDSIVAFVEEIEYIQGLYPSDTGVIWDSLKLKDTLNKPKNKAKYHKVKANENAKSIAKKYSLTVKQLKAFNPKVDFDDLKENSKLLVEAETDYVRIKVMRSRKKVSSIPYETLKKENSSMLKGTTKISQKGSAGQRVTTELVTYINGKETYSTVVSTKQTKAPVNQIIQVGTKSVYYSGGSSVSSYGNSSSGFIWPARGAYSLSSRYGYRSASISGWSFHGGVDIVKPGGHSTGTPVIAAASGTVVIAYAGYSGYGNTVVIDHGNGIRTRYAHMQSGSIAVRVGQRVYQGQQIGRIGSTGNVTGPHLHFEVLRNGSKVNPLAYIR